MTGRGLEEFGGLGGLRALGVVAWKVACWVEAVDVVIWWCSTDLQSWGGQEIWDSYAEDALNGATPSDLGASEEYESQWSKVIPLLCCCP